jgi:hypothetical protein
MTSIYNATGSLARFENINILKNALAYYNAGVVAVNSKVNLQRQRCKNLQRN